MKTVTQVMDWYNKQHADTYDYIVVTNPAEGINETLTYFDVSGINKMNGILSFYGKSLYEKSIGGVTRFVRLNHAIVVRSEV